VRNGHGDGVVLAQVAKEAKVERVVPIKEPAKGREHKGECTLEELRALPLVASSREGDSRCEFCGCVAGLMVLKWCKSYGCKCHKRSV